MLGQNNQTVPGFIAAISHPRKKQLAEMLIDGATVEALAEVGFSRINALEMARSIRQNVEGMKEFTFDWPRDVDVKVANPVVAETTPEVTPEATVETETVTTTEETVPEVTATPEVTPEATVETQG